MSLIERWMPAYDVAARYSIHISATPAQVYATLLATDFGRSWLVRGLMGIRLVPALVRSPVSTWRRLVASSKASRASLAQIERSGFVRLEELPPHEIVLGITGRFWTMAADIVPIAPDHFREGLPAGVAQAVWNFQVDEAVGGAVLATETRIRCADASTLRRFRWYWRFVAPGSGLIRYAVLRQVRREAQAAVG